MMLKKKYITIIPAFNEEAKIAEVVQKIRSMDIIDEVVVIDDGSDDRTIIKARDAGATVIPLIVHLGYGAALQTGYKYAHNHHCDAVVQIDGDGQHDPQYISDFIVKIEKDGYDVVIGSRFLGGHRHYRVALTRRIGMRFFQFLILLFIRKRFTDPTSGFQALHKNVIDFFAKSNYYPPDYPDADMILLLYNLGFKIVEIPVVMYESQTGKSMHSGLRPLYYMVKMMLSIFSVLFGQHRTFLRKKI
ncbi:glycosyltransferase family 2 protein [bacterium]|nr:glycosyltransferase family 2 protein [bacterium]